ncbi:efflux RND transporter periplasmic adaptor subunit [Pseudolysobacter antarcticus]|uniref:Efflux RND transporter periplasmic adaptor subunit n=1 Tax=Pseudolysobacter antarcticus TaxID=2511995 RepID=A0A411HJM1_9GAMM|nr:efflux RND transporter periplasmic adaptor subunit [Pseudolysobacter antarcticus]QBB70587.1 efflux RND transporter periplasmic adaptor subunit [Pseudolysobacter antarcticus]
MQSKSLKLQQLICGGILLAAFGALSGCGGGQAAPAVDAKKDAVNAVPVEVAEAGRNAISASYSGTASLVADHEAQVVAKTSGVMLKLFVEEGMLVKEGQLLAQLDDANARSSAAQTEAQMHKAEAVFARAEQSIKKELIPKAEYDTDKFDMLSQRAAFEVAKLQLAYTRIVAPVSGVIAERSVKIGNYVQTNATMFRIVGMDPLQAVLNVPERQLGILKAGQTVRLDADALSGKKFTGEIKRIAPVVDPASGTFRVTCEFHDTTGILRPGMFGRIEIVYDHRESALTVPRSAVVEEDGETSVFVVEAAPPAAAKTDAAKTDAAKTNKPADKAVAAAPAVPGMVAHRRLVKLGYLDTDRAEIREGIEDGARVITVGRNAVREGTAVQVLPSQVVEKQVADKKA